ncbi:MAG: hypothetical protein ABSG73_04125 [Candidatus Aminicenantales bacterium]|jgi:hypothetical protein
MEERAGFELLEKFKDIQRLQFEYFKHLSTISASSLGIIVALSKVFFPNTKIVCLLILSLLSITCCLIAAVSAMPLVANSILYILRAQAGKAIREKDPDPIIDQYSRALDKIEDFDRFTRITLMAGAVLFLIFAAINLVK